MIDPAPEARGAASASIHPARHGVTPPRGQSAIVGERGGRFGRMFPALSARDPGAAAIEELVAHMGRLPRERSIENERIPAGYTYLGQFVDHDITFDPTSRLERRNDPQALVNFRTPRFDLDCVYGSGPSDQPFLYDWADERAPGVKLLVGGTPGDPSRASMDLPRNQQGRALLGDPRNDENLIVAQLHLLFMRFHNTVVDHVAERAPQLTGADLLAEAQRIVCWHYQWIVMHDFLERIAGSQMAHSVLVGATAGAAARVEARYYTWQGQPFVPVEFSGAAYRFGHSMVRADYELNRTARSVALFAADGDERGAHLGGGRSLPADLVIDWELFFGPRALMSMRIDQHLAPPLTRVPPAGESLVRLNLRRGRALGLPAGADVARAMGLEPLTPEELLLDDATAQLMPGAAREALLAATPLWYYVLCDARRSGRVGGPGGLHLGPLGGRIVAEVLAGLLAGDPQSYLHRQPDWTPELPGGAGDFTMADLVRFTLAGAHA